MRGKATASVLVVGLVCGCAQYDSYKGGFDSLVVSTIDGRLDSLASGIVSTDSAINRGFQRIAGTINGLKEKVATLENEIKSLRHENKKLREIIDGYRRDGKPFRLLPTEGTGNKGN